MRNQEQDQDNRPMLDVEALEASFAHVASARDLLTDEARHAAAVQRSFIHLITELRNLAVDLHRQASKPFPFSEENSHEEDLAMCHWRGYNEGLDLATRALEHLLEEPSSVTP